MRSGPKKKKNGFFFLFVGRPPLSLSLSLFSFFFFLFPFEPSFLIVGNRSPLTRTDPLREIPVRVIPTGGSPLSPPPGLGPGRCFRDPFRVTWVGTFPVPPQFAWRFGSPYPNRIWNGSGKSTQPGLGVFSFSLFYFFWLAFCVGFLGPYAKYGWALI